MAVVLCSAERADTDVTALARGAIVLIAAAACAEIILVESVRLPLTTSQVVRCFERKYRTLDPQEDRKTGRLLSLLPVFLRNRSTRRLRNFRMFRTARSQSR